MWWFLVMAPALAGGPVVEGRFLVDEPPEALREKHAAAVSEAMALLPWALRPFARSRLESAIRTCSVLEVDLDGATFDSRCDSLDRVVRPMEGGPTTFTADDGKSYQVTVEATPSAAILTFTGREGGQRTRYVPQPDGSLVVTKDLFSDYLGEPVSWSVRYRRAEAAAGAEE